MIQESPVEFKISLEQISTAVTLIEKCLNHGELINKQKVVRLQIYLHKTFGLPDDLRLTKYEEQPYKTQSDIVIDDKLRKNMISLLKALMHLLQRNIHNVKPEKLSDWISYLTVTSTDNTQDIDELIRRERMIDNAPEFVEA